jgi:hypothetical protein
VNDWDELGDRCFAMSDRDDLPSFYSREKLREMVLAA